MKTIDIIASVREYMDGGNFATLEKLLQRLENDYKLEQLKKSGDNGAAKRLMLINKVLRMNLTNGLPEGFKKTAFDTCNGEEYQFCMTSAFLIALKREYSVPAATFGEADGETIKPNYGQFMPSQRNTYKEISLDIVEVKADLARWRERQRLKAKKEREQYCAVPLGDIAGVGFSAEYLILLHDVLNCPDGVKFYQNQSAYGLSYLESPVGVCVLCPCKIKK